MENYKLTEDAKSDLIRIHQHGVREYGEIRADKYYIAFFERFEKIAEQPYLYQAVDYIREGYRRSVCGADSIYYRVNGNTVEIMNILGRQDNSELL
ncbi:MAG: type II toxin-antitoxin system RelE/ParE family toxin [Gammaproteobacteria bacterium]|nr:type II toxin-antitoxin system RelE/ParE family toxin [Gammaproteobacteria bacterium]